MTHAFGGPSGRYSGRLLSIEIDSTVRITRYTADDGSDVERIEGIYKGPVYDFQMARVRLPAVDARFAATNIAAEPLVVTELAIVPDNFEVVIPASWRRARVTS